MKLRISLALGLVSPSTASVCGNIPNRRLTFLEAVGKQHAALPPPVKGKHAFKDDDGSDKKAKLHQAFVDGDGGSGIHNIVGGVVAEEGRYPYMALLNAGTWNDGSIYYPYCGGTMIAKDAVLTAAHCVDGFWFDYIAVGGHNWEQPWKGENIKMKKIFVHPEYVSWSLKNDFAVVVLEYATSLNMTFPLFNSDGMYPSVDTISRVMGWGRKSYWGSQSANLREVDIPIISNEDCDECYGSSGDITSEMICAYNDGGGKDSCQGDSGGPLIIPGADSSKDILIGVVSWGIGCAFEGYPGVYARLSSGFNWVKETVCEESSSPQTEFCEASYAPTPTPPTQPPTTSLSPTFGPVEGFSFVGEGYCTDSNGSLYSAFGKYFYSNDDDECISWCANVPHPDLVGVEVDYYGPSEYDCWCDFSNGLPDDINRTDYEPNAVFTYLASGFGPILGANNRSDVWCYQYDNFKLSFPASAISIELDTGENINMYSLQVMDTSGNDVALNKPSSQSSTFKTFAASLSVDGDDNTFSHTDIQSQQDDSTAWWKVDLQQEIRVSAVAIKNRWCTNNPACLCRLSNASISLLDDFGDVIATQNTGDTCGQNDLSYSDFSPSFNEVPTNWPTAWPTWVSDFPTTGPPSPAPKVCYPIASKVKLQSITGKPIQMFEIQVFSSGENVALGKTATQSSTYKDKPQFGAPAAVDGNLLSFSHTEYDSCLWFEVDLEASLSIESFKIMNRWCVDVSDPNGCLCRMSRVAVSLFDGDMWVDTTVIGDTCGMEEWVHMYGSSDFCTIA